MYFSDRTPGDLTPNPIAQALQKLTRPYDDLTESNPTRCGLGYPPDLLEELGRPEALKYEPHPFGSAEARETVADYLNSKGQKVEPEKVVLTASTSESYSYLFKLLGNPGHSLLAPVPSYPLLDHLIRLEGMSLVPFPFQKTSGWPLDRHALEEAVDSDCRGLVVVNPNNPTGTFLSRGDQEYLGKLCEGRRIPCISDEVFSDYVYPPGVFTPWVPQPVLSFRLGGLSKSLGLPQLKLSWMVMEGPDGLLRECRERLELIADSYLSVNTPVLLALKSLFKFAPLFQDQLMKRLLANRAFLENCLSLEVPPSTAKLWPAQGGWYALVEMTQEGVEEETLVLGLLEKEGVFVQPGGFYDFPEGRFLVISLLPQPEIFQRGAGRLARFLRGNQSFGK